MNTRTLAALRRASPRFVAVAGSLAALLASPSVYAAAGSWNSASDGSWSDTTKWTSGTVANGATFSANFNATTGTTGVTYTTTLDSVRTVGGFFKTTTGIGNWTVTGSNLLTLDNGGSNSTVSNGQNAISTLTLDVDILLNSNMVLSGYGNNNAKVTIGSTVGAHTITGAKNITFSNTVNNSAGALTINNNINTSGGIINSSTATSGSNNLIAGNIGSTVTGVTQSGSRALTLSGVNAYTGATNITQGNLIAGVASVANVSGAFGVNSAVTLSNVASTNLNLNGFNNQIGSLAGGGTTGGNVILGVATLTTGGDNTSTTFAGVISSSTGGGLTKIGSGTQTLSGAHTYNGNTLIGAGTLALTGTASLATADVSISSGATFDVSGLSSAYTVASGKSLGGDGTVTGALSFASGGNFTFGAAATLDVTGAVTFGGFGIANILGLNSSTVAGSYLLLNGSGSNIDFTNVSNIGLSNAYDLGNGAAAYFDTTGGDLGLIVASAVPEPGTYALLGGLAALGFAWVRRRCRSV